MAASGFSLSFLPGIGFTFDLLLLFPEVGAQRWQDPLTPDTPTSYPHPPSSFRFELPVPLFLALPYSKVLKVSGFTQIGHQRAQTGSGSWK